jgi:hypothetical protein
LALMTVSAYRLACMFLNVLTVIAHWEEVFDAFGDMRNARGTSTCSSWRRSPTARSALARSFGRREQSQPLIVECTKYERPHSRTYHNGGPVEVEPDINVTPRDDGWVVVARFDAIPNGHRSPDRRYLPSDDQLLCAA